MNKIKVYILIEDKEYANALGRAMASLCSRFDVYIGPMPKDPADDEVMITDMEGGDRSNVIWLTGDVKDAGPGKAYRYIGVRDLEKIILAGFALSGGELKAGLGRASVSAVAFASTGGRSGATSLAIATARMLEMLYGRRVLYLNLNFIDDSVKYFPTEKKGVLKLCYDLLEKDDFPLEPYITTEEDVDRLDTLLMNKVSEDMDIGMLGKLIEKMGEMGRYGYLFLDIGTSINGMNSELLSEADSAVICSRASESIHFLQIGEMEGKLKEMARDSILVRNLADPNGDGEEGDGFRYISSDRRAFIMMGGRVRIDLRGSYGLEVAELAKEIEVKSGGINRRDFSGKEKNSGGTNRGQRTW